METSITNEASLLVLSLSVTFLVQLAKRLKMNPLLLLAIFSFLASALYSYVIYRVSGEIVNDWNYKMIQIAATANLIYNVLKVFLKQR